MTKPSFLIRDAQVKDAPILAQAEREVAETPGFLVSLPHELPDERFVKKIQELSLIPNGKYLVAELDGKLIGHGILEPLHLDAIKHVVHLTLIAHPGHQAQGVGRTLLQALIDWARDTPSVEKIELHVRSENYGAQRLYLKMGFTEEGRLKNRVRIREGKYLDDVLMGLWVK